MARRFAFAVARSADRCLSSAEVCGARADAHELVGEGNLPGLVPKVVRLLHQADPFDIEAVFKWRNGLALLGGVALSLEAALRQLRRIQHHRVRIDGAEPLAGISTIHQDQADTLDALNIKKRTLNAQMSH